MRKVLFNFKKGFSNNYDWIPKKVLTDLGPLDIDLIDALTEAPKDVFNISFDSDSTSKSANILIILSKLEDKHDPILKAIFRYCAAYNGQFKISIALDEGEAAFLETKSKVLTSNELRGAVDSASYFVTFLEKLATKHNILFKHWLLMSNFFHLLLEKHSTRINEGKEIIFYQFEDYVNSYLTCTLYADVTPEERINYLLLNKYANLMRTLQVYCHSTIIVQLLTY